MMRHARVDPLRAAIEQTRLPRRVQPETQFLISRQVSKPPDGDTLPIALDLQIRFIAKNENMSTLT